MREPEHAAQLWMLVTYSQEPHLMQKGHTSACCMVQRLNTYLSKVPGRWKAAAG